MFSRVFSLLVLLSTLLIVTSLSRVYMTRHPQHQCHVVVVAAVVSFWGILNIFILVLTNTQTVSIRLKY